MITRRIYQTGTRAYGCAARSLYPGLKLPPLRVTIMSTSRCNLTCPFCSYRGQLNQDETNNLTTGEWFRIFDSIPRFAAVDFAGAEPFLTPDFGELLDYLLTRRKCVWILSNGTAVKDDMVRFLVDRRLAFFRCSVDGMAEYHNRVRGNPRAFESVTGVLKDIQDYKGARKTRFPITGIKTNIMNDNWDQIPELLSYAEHELGVDQIYFNLMFDNPLTQGFEFADDLTHHGLTRGNTYGYASESIEKVEEAVRHIFEYRRKSNISIGLSQDMSDEDTIGYIRDPSAYGVRACNEPWTGFSLYWDGTVTPCASYRVANIRDLGYDVRKVIGHPRYGQFLSFLKEQQPFPPHCGGCCAKHASVD